MTIEVPDEVQTQALEAGFASVQEYVANLLGREAERVAIQQGIDAMEAGDTQPFDEFDREFRKRNGLPLRS